jgi:hypothetical protein
MFVKIKPINQKVMKLLILTGFALTLFSCVKEKSCTCIDSDNYAYVIVLKGTTSDMKDECEGSVEIISIDDVPYENATNCKLD